MFYMNCKLLFFFFFFNDTPTTEIYTLSLHDALPISDRYLPDKAIDLIDEAGSRLRIRRMGAPADYREFEEEIAKVRRDKEGAIEGQQFEQAASLRDREKELLEERSTKETELRAEG